MKVKYVIALLAVVALGLGILLIRQNQKGKEQQRVYEDHLHSLSNKLTKTELNLANQIQVNNVLEKELTSKTIESQNLTSKLSMTSTNLATVSSNLVKVESEAKAATEAVRLANEELARRDAVIKEKDSQNDSLSKAMDGLKGSITQLESKITDTQTRLAAAEGDREFLLKELKRLQTEKLELERQFHDLALLRDQVRKLKEELSISRRMDWIRRGLLGVAVKGAEKLQKAAVAAPAKTNADLNVEIKREGGAKIVTPIPAPAPPKPTTEVK